MAKTRKDFDLETPLWLAEDWIPMGHRCMDTAPEGSFKTIMGCWMAVCIASGHPLFGHNVYQGPVLIVDEETPEVSLDNHLDRFSRGLGLKYRNLPIHRMSMQGFRFGRKTEMDKLLKVIADVEPVFIRLDSLLAMLPSGRQGLSENDGNLGEIVRDDLNGILRINPNCSILLSAHSKKFASELSPGESGEYEMVSLVRGHGSIVGQGCDTGYIVSKTSEYPEPTRFSITVKVRRQAIPAGVNVKHLELVEQEYGKGWARLKEISYADLPPSSLARAIYPIFTDIDNRTGQIIKEHKASKIVSTSAFLTKRECRMGTKELLQRKVIIKNNKSSNTYGLNPNRFSECVANYLIELENSPTGSI